LTFNPVRDSPSVSVNYLNVEAQQFVKPFENRRFLSNPLGSVLLACEPVRRNVDSWGRHVSIYRSQATCIYANSRRWKSRWTTPSEVFRHLRLPSFSFIQPARCGKQIWAETPLIITSSQFPARVADMFNDSPDIPANAQSIV